MDIGNRSSLIDSDSDSELETNIGENDFNISDRNDFLNQNQNDLTNTTDVINLQQASAPTVMNLHQARVLLAEANNTIKVLSQTLASTQRQLEFYKEESLASSTQSLNEARLQIKQNKATATSLRLSLQKLANPYIKFPDREMLKSQSPNSISDRVMNDLGIEPNRRSKFWGSHWLKAYFYMQECKTKFAARVKRQFYQGE